MTTQISMNGQHARHTRMELRFAGCAFVLAVVSMCAMSIFFGVAAIACGAVATYHGDRRGAIERRRAALRS